MRHHRKGRAFARVAKGKTALMRSLACSLISKEKIVTTEAKARELRPYIEKLVTKCRKDTVANRRLVGAKLGNAVRATAKLFSDISPRYIDRAGGYTRITKLPPRKSDSSKQAMIEFV